MILFFRRLLINIGKFTPFLLVFLLLINYVENATAVIADITKADENGDFYYNTPISEFISELIYIDWFDIVLLYTLCFALELCWRTFMCVHVLLANMAFRNVLESVELQVRLIVYIQFFLAFCAILCVLFGIQIFITKYTKKK